MLTMASRSIAYAIAWRNSARSEIRLGLLQRRARRQVEPQHVRIDAGADVRELERALVAQPAQRREVFGADVGLRHEIRRARLEPQDLGVLRRDELDDEPIEIRQLDAGGVLLPVVGIARERHPLAGDVLGEHERARVRPSCRAWSAGPTRRRTCARRARPAAGAADRSARCRGARRRVKTAPAA